MSRKRVYIITGANGFLGNNIIRKLASSDAEIRSLVLPGDSVHSLDGLPCRVYEGDVTKKETLEDIFRVEPDDQVFVIHCAAIVYIKSKYSQKVYDVNVGGTKNVIDKVMQIGAKLVYVSSVHALPEKPANEVMEEVASFDPEKVVGLYAKTKSEIANYVLQMVHEKGLNACIVHPSGMIGPFDFGNSHLTQLILDFANRKLTACVSGGYDFVDVRDVADGIISACDSGRAGECYLLSNKFVAVKDLLDLISEVEGIGKIRTVLPMWFAKLTAPASELYYALLKQPPLYTRYSLYTLTANAHFSCKKAMQELGYHPRSLQDTIRDTVTWLDAQGRIKKRALA